MAYGYIAKLNENVVRKHVRYNNRYGIAIAADIYRAKDLDETKKYPALIVGAPYGGVKEQGPCVYANELARRGFHPNARGGFTTTSNMAFTNFRLLDFIAEISPRPILFVMGDRAHSKFFSENAYAAAAEPKELYVVEDAEHIDLYDRVDRIPFDKLENFFKENLK